MLALLAEGMMSDAAEVAAWVGVVVVGVVRKVAVVRDRRSDATRRASLAVLLLLGCTVRRRQRPLRGAALQVARAMDTDRDPESLMRRFRLSPERLASICITITSATRE